METFQFRLISKGKCLFWVENRSGFDLLYGHVCPARSKCGFFYKKSGITILTLALYKFKQCVQNRRKRVIARLYLRFVSSCYIILETSLLKIFTKIVMYSIFKIKEIRSKSLPYDFTITLKEENIGTKLLLSWRTFHKDSEFKLFHILPTNFQQNLVL